MIDISLNPGDGRVVAKALRRRYGTAVLFVTALAHEARGLSSSGAVAYLSKPCEAEDVPKALQAVERIRRWIAPGQLPDHMVALPAEG